MERCPAVSRVQQCFRESGHHGGHIFKEFVGYTWPDGTIIDTDEPPPPTLAEAEYPCGATACTCSRGGCAGLSPPGADAIIANLRQRLGAEKATRQRQGEALAACLVRREQGERDLAEAVEVIEAMSRLLANADPQAAWMAGKAFLALVKGGGG